MERILASEALLSALKEKDGVRTRGAPRRISFDGTSTLEEFPSG
jgi:hypothetical protein